MLQSNDFDIITSRSGRKIWRLHIDFSIFYSILNTTGFSMKWKYSTTTKPPTEIRRSENKCGKKKTIDENYIKRKCQNNDTQSPWNMCVCLAYHWHIVGFAPRTIFILCSRNVDTDRNERFFIHWECGALHWAPSFVIEY